MNLNILSTFNAAQQRLVPTRPMVMHARSFAGAASLFSVLAACASEAPGGFAAGASTSEPATGFGDEQGVPMPEVDQFANDPPAPWCGPAGKPAPMNPGGTLACPDDKNKPGCPCAIPDEEVSCWTGLRKHRKLGICKDGIARCERTSETTFGWSKCEGQVLPTPGAKKGAAACGCFSKGQWKIANTVPCTIDFGSAKYTVSTVLNGAKVACPSPSGVVPPPVPATPWSSNTLTVDCAGRFKLCYTIKAGKAEAPSAADCTVAKVCTEGDYPKENVETTFPILPAWASTDPVCSRKFDEGGGYGEMTVIGKSVRCDAIDDGAGKPLVFQRATYCPASCNDTPTTPECARCQQGGNGTF
jgi:hypothetical protein